MDQSKVNNMEMVLVVPVVVIIAPVAPAALAAPAAPAAPGPIVQSGRLIIWPLHPFPSRHTLTFGWQL
jgi:hypothetical protein